MIMYIRLHLSKIGVFHSVYKMQCLFYRRLEKNPSFLQISCSQNDGFYTLIYKAATPVFSTFIFLLPCFKNHAVRVLYDNVSS